MKSSRMVASGLTSVLLAGSVLFSAHGAEREAPSEKEIAEALASLPRADKEAAAAQRYCVMASDNRLGSMGAPVKLTIGGQPVFVCCKGCVKRALANPKATLARAKKLQKIAAAMGKLSSEDRKAAETQRFCAVESENLLGTMGAPVKLTIGGSPVFICCAGCKAAAQADPRGTLANARRLAEQE